MLVKDRKLQWRDFADFATLEKLLGDFALLTGITTVIIDTGGEHITRQTLPHNELCMRLIKGAPLGKQRCDECDLEWGTKAAEEQTYKVYTCKNGLIDFVAPIMIEDEVLGHLFGGQVLAAEDPLDKEWHVQNARELGIDPIAYLEALNKIPVLPQDMIEAAARVLYNTADFISTLTTKWVNEREEAREQREALASLREMVAGMIAGLDLQVALEKAVERTAELVGADIVTIHLYSPLTGEVHAAAGCGLLDRETFQQHKPGRGRVALLVASEGEPVIAEDVSVSELAGPFAAREGVQSAAGFPLKVGDRVIGVLFVNYREPHNFESEEVETLVSFGNLAAVAINAANSYEQAKARAQTIRQLGEVGQSLIVVRDLKSLLQKIAEAAGSVLEADVIVLYEYREETDDVKMPPVTWGDIRYPEVLRERNQVRPHKESAVFKMLERTDPFYAPNAREDWVQLIEEWPQEERKSETFVHREGIISSAAVPLMVGEEGVGVLFVNYRVPHVFRDEEQKTIELFATQAAIAIQNARLFDDAQHRIRDMGIVNEVVQIISTKLDTQALLETIVSQIADRLNCTHCTLFLSQKENGESLLVPQVTHGVRSEEIMTRRFKPGEGLAGWVFQHSESLVLADARGDSRLAPARGGQDRPRSMLVAPVRVGDQTIGVISADQDEYGWFSESDRRLAEALARHAGIAIERAIGLDLLQRIGNRIISHPEVNEILQQIVTGAIELTNTNTGVIYLISEDGQSVTNSFFPPGFEHPRPRLERKEGLTRHVIETGKVLSIPDIHQDPRVNPVLLDHFHSMIAVPLKIEERVIGVLYLNDEDQHDFSETEESLLSTLVSQAAIAIENARLFETMQRLNAQLEGLHQVVREQNLEKVLDRIVGGISAILGKGTSPTINLYEEETDSFGQCHACGPLEDVLKVPPRLDGTGRYVLKTGEPLYLDDVLNPPPGCPTVRDESIAIGIKSFAALPLKRQEQMVGVLFVNLQKPVSFSEEIRRILELFANQAAIAIRNAQLFEQLSLANKTLREEHGRRLAAESWATLGKAAGNLLHRINDTTGIIPVAAQSLRELLEGVPIDDKRRRDITADLDRIERNSRNTLQFAKGLWKPFDVLPTERHGVSVLLKEAVSVADIPAGVYLETQLDGNLPMILTSHLLTDVFVELITNAVRAMPDGGRLTIAGKKVRDNHVEIQFSDTGRGISSENLEKIFGLFFTTDKSSLGFGLWWVKTFLTSQGGTISVKSKKGKGATFIIRLPIEGPRAPAE